MKVISIKGANVIIFSNTEQMFISKLSKKHSRMCDIVRLL